MDHSLIRHPCKWSGTVLAHILLTDTHKQLFTGGGLCTITTHCPSIPGLLLGRTGNVCQLIDSSERPQTRIQRGAHSSHSSSCPGDRVDPDGGRTANGDCCPPTLVHSHSLLSLFSNHITQSMLLTPDSPFLHLSSLRPCTLPTGCTLICTPKWPCT